MPHIDLPDGVPGIQGPMMFRPETARPLKELAEVLLRGDNTLSRGERELIAAYVSWLNGCQFCQRSHGTFAAFQLEGGSDVVDAVKRDPDTAPVSEKMKTLLPIAAKVQRDGRSVTNADIAAARAQGSTDTEIHDTVLIAAAFCMYNRYVDGLATSAPDDQGPYDSSAARIIEHGYVGSVPTPAA